MHKRLNLQKLVKKNTFTQDVMFTVVGQSGVMLIALLINKVVSNYLSPADFTIFSIANRSASVLAFLMLFGLGIAMPRYIASNRAKENLKAEASLFYASLLLLTVATFTIFTFTIFFQNDLANFIFNDTSRVSLIIPTLLFSIGIAISSFVYAYFRGVDKFKQYNAIQILFQTASFVLVLASGTNIAMQLSLRGTVISLLSIIVLGYITFVTYRGVIAPWSKLEENGKKLFAYCLPRVPGEAFLFSYTVLPLVIINTKYGLHVAAGFATAITLNTIVTPLFQFVGMVLLPYVSKNIAKGETNDIQTKVRKLRKLYLFIGVSSVMTIWLFAEMLITLLFSKEYAQFSTIVRIVYISVVPYSLYLLLRNPLDAISKFPFNTLNLGISFIIFIIMIVLSPNMYVCAIAFPVSYLLLGILSEISWAGQFDKAKDKFVNVNTKDEME